MARVYLRSMESENGAPMETEVGKRIRAARGYKGLSQPQLAAAIKVGRVKVTDWEMGRDEPDDGDLYKISTACGLPIEFFSVNLQALGEPVSADDLFSVLEEIRQATNLIPQGMKYLEGLVSDDTIRRMFPDAGGS